MNAEWNDLTCFGQKSSSSHDRLTDAVFHGGSMVCMCVFLRPDGLSTVKVDEKERFEEIKERLRVILENQITHFR